MLVAVAQPLVLNAVTKVAGEYLPAERRAARNRVGSAGIFAGMLLALVLGTRFGGAHPPLLVVAGARSLLAAAAALSLMLSATAPRAARTERVAHRRRRAARGLGDCCVCGAEGLLFLGFGAFIALTTWLQALLHHYRISVDTAGTLLVAMVLAGAVGAAVLPPIVVTPPRRAARSSAPRSRPSSSAALLLAFEHAVAVDAIVLVPMGCCC